MFECQIIRHYSIKHIEPWLEYILIYNLISWRGSNPSGYDSIYWPIFV